MGFNTPVCCSLAFVAERCCKMGFQTGDWVSKLVKPSSCQTPSLYRSVYVCMYVYRCVYMHIYIYIYYIMYTLCIYIIYQYLHPSYYLYLNLYRYLLMYVWVHTAVYTHDNTLLKASVMNLQICKSDPHVEEPPRF